MATFTADVFQNEYLPDGATEVHAVVTVTCTDAGQAGRHHRERQRLGGQHDRHRGHPERSCRTVPHHLQRALGRPVTAESVDGVGQTVDV